MLLEPRWHDPRREHPERDPRVRYSLAARNARDVLGFDELRPAQVQALKAVLAGHDTLTVMPTGSGKSAIYQLAAISGAGPAVVISPLLALQRDQVEALEAKRPGTAAAWNSTISASARREIDRRWRQGELDLLYLAPESIESTGDMLTKHPPKLAVVDEAHCVLEWGHDFRPEYLNLPVHFDSWRCPPVLALTATASPPARDAIAELLDLWDPDVFVAGFNRPEIHLAVERFRDATEKRAALLNEATHLSKTSGGAGIVYCATREGTEDVASALAARGVKTAVYHGGLGRTERARVQDAFDTNEIDLIAATLAFGLGVDKPDVRFVLHLDPPASLDAYYQEAGRAGRDGQPAEAKLFWCPDDLVLQRFMGGGMTLESETLERVVTALAAVGEPVAPHLVQQDLGLTDARASAVLRRLEEVGAVEIFENGWVMAIRGVDTRAAVVEALKLQGRYRRYVRSRLDMLKAYAEGSGCRRAFLLGYFGEAHDAPCGNCDLCDQLGHTGAETDAQVFPFRVGYRVEHDLYGPGEITGIDDEKVTLRFEREGYMQLALDHVLENQLLRPGDGVAPVPDASAS